MRTEEYILILVGVVAEPNQIKITYTSNAPESSTVIRVIYSNGKIIKTFEQVKKAEKGVLTISTEGLMPGAYTCTISGQNEVRDSKKFTLG